MNTIKNLPKTNFFYQSLHQYRTNQSNTYHPILNHQVLTKAVVLGALKVISAKSIGATAKERQQQKQSAKELIQRYLGYWLYPLFEWQDSITCDGEEFDLSVLDEESLAYQFFQREKLSSNILIQMLDEELHLTLSKFSATREFAYHGRLMEPLRKVLKKVITHDNNWALTTDNKNGIYLHLRQLKVEDANLLPCPYISGMPSMMAFWGWVHDFERRINQNGNKYLKVDSVACFIHEIGYATGQRLSEAKVVKPRDKTYKVARSGNRTGAWGDFKFDIIIKLKSSDFLDTSLLTQEHLTGCVPRKFHGGNLFVDIKSKDWIRTYDSQKALFKSLAAFPSSGCWLYPSRQEFADEASLLTILNNNSAQKLALSGYQFLEKPKQRENSHEDEHVYAESALGLVNCVNAIDVRMSGINAFFLDAFWALIETDSSITMSARN